MKRGIGVFLVLLCAAACFGCGAQPAEASAQAAEYGCFCYPGTEWGMTETEFFQAIGAEEGDFQQLEPGDYPSPVCHIGENEEFQEEPVSMRAEFSRSFLGKTPLLSRVLLVYQERKPPEAFTELCEALSGEVAAQKVAVNEPEWREEPTFVSEGGDEPSGETDTPPNGVWRSWTLESAATSGDLPQDLQDSAERYVAYGLEHNETALRGSAKSLVGAMSAEPLSTLRVNYVQKEGEADGTLYVTFSGTGIWRMLSCREANLELGIETPADSNGNGDFIGNGN